MLILQVLSFCLAFSVIYGGRTDLNINCPSGTSASFTGDKCWMLVSIPQNFIEAAQYCRSFGGNLTSIHNAFDNIYLADLAHFFSHDYYYIGGSNLGDRKTWAWIDGSDMEFSDWGNYEPIDGTLNNCLIVAVGHAIWHTHDCTTASPFVCEVPEDHSLPQTTTVLPPMTTTARQDWNLTSTTANWNFTTTTILLQNVTASMSTTTAAANTTLAKTTTVAAPSVSPNANSNGTSNMPFSPSPNTTSTESPFAPGEITNSNSVPEKDPSSTPKRESSTPFMSSGANSNRLFNSFLTSLAVGKAAEYFPKFDNKQINAGKQQQHQNSRFKSYRQQ